MPLNERRSQWDLKYEQGLPSLEKPDPFYLSAFDEFVADSFPNGGTALDLAGGIGRHALWLAKRNWQVTVVDISEVAIRKLDQKARQFDLTLDLLALDATEYPFKPACFDLIVMFYHFDRDICPKVLSTLRPGGILICKSGLSWDPYEGIAPVNIRPLARSEILSILPGLRVMHHQERPVRDRGVVEYVGKKPEFREITTPQMTESRIPQDPATNSRSRMLAFPVDQIGVWTSTLCVIHCLLTPVLLSLWVVSVHFLPSEERTHRTLAVGIAALGALALVKGFRRHRSWRVLTFMAAGLAFIFGGAFWGDHLPSHWVEVLVTLSGSGFMIAAHRANHTFCRDCSCSHSN